MYGLHVELMPIETAIVRMPDRLGSGWDGVLIGTNGAGCMAGLRCSHTPPMALAQTGKTPAAFRCELNEGGREANATGCPPAMTETRSSSGLVVSHHATSEERHLPSIIGQAWPFPHPPISPR